MALADDRRFTLSSDAASRILDGEAVILDLASGKYLGLNDVATRVWQLLGEGKTCGAIRSELLTEFDVDHDVLVADIDRLLADMEARGLIRPSS